MNRITRRLVVTVAVAACVLPRALDAAEPSQSIKPNILFILADDLGAHDVGCYGSTFYETPNIDRLATRGVKFTQAYAASPLCSPTRASILAGQYPARIGITMPECHLPEVRLEKKLAPTAPTMRAINAESLTRLKPDYFTLAEALHEASYATAHFGKWHLGHNRAGHPDDHYEPTDQGFDVDFPHPAPDGPATGYLAPWKFIKDRHVVGKPGEHIEDRLSEEAAKYIRAHKDRPFYLNYCAYSVHAPWTARRDYIDYFKPNADPKNRQRNPLYAAMVRSLDDAVGRLLTAVDDAGIADRTIVVFFSDNGGFSYRPRATRSPRFREAARYQQFPVAQWQVVALRGWYPRAARRRLAGQDQCGDDQRCSVPKRRLLSHAAGHVRPQAPCQRQARRPRSKRHAPWPTIAPRDRVFCHFPHCNPPNRAKAIDGALPGTSARRGDWKLLRFFADNDDGSDRLELYNLREDVRRIEKPGRRKAGAGARVERAHQRFPPRYGSCGPHPESRLPGAGTAAVRFLENGYSSGG